MNIDVSTAQITITIDDFVPIPLTGFGCTKYHMALELLNGATGVTLQDHVLTIKGASPANPWLLNFTLAPESIDDYVLIGAFFQQNKVIITERSENVQPVGNVGIQTFPLILLNRDQIPALVTYSADLNIFTVPPATMSILDIGESGLEPQPPFTYAIAVQQISSGRLAILDPDIRNEPS